MDLKVLKIPSEDKLLCLMLVGLLCLPLTSLNFVFAQSTGVISGRVTNLQTGMGISGANVSAVGPSVEETTADSLGYYTISGLAPGPYTITASASGYVGKSFSNRFIREAETTPLSFQLNMRSIKGKVFDASKPTSPIAEANITIGENFVLTNASGYYEWLDLSAGTHTLTASAPGYGSESHQVGVSVGVTATVDFGLSPVALGRIVGIVTDSTTKDGLPGATVLVRRGSFEKTSNTDLNGQYSIENVPAWTSWTIDAYKLGYIAETVPASVQSEATTTLDFELDSYGNINGTVRDQNTNLPIEGALVRADSVLLDTTDSSGYYNMFAEGGYTYTVTASAPGYSSRSQSNVKVTAGETETVDFLLQFVLPGSIVGRVTDKMTTLGVAGALVTADGHSNITNADGNYILSNMPAWTYTISVSASEYLGGSTQRTVPSGGSITADFALNPDTRVSLQPYISFGNPGNFFSVDLYLSDSRFVYSWEIYLWWNPTLLEASLDEGSFLKGPFGNRTTEFSFDEYVNEGVVHASCLSTLPAPDNGVSGSGTLATLTFRIIAKGLCSISITSALLFSPPPGMPTFISVFENAIFRTVQSDANNDGVVNGLDLVCVKEAYGSNPGDTYWNASTDVNRDQTIDAIDLHRIGKDYGKSV